MLASSPQPGDLVALTGWSKVARTRPGVVIELGDELNNWAYVQWHEPGQTGGTVWTQWHPVANLSVISTT